MNRSYDDSYNWLKSRDFMRKERRDLTITLSILATEIVLIIIHYLN